MAWHILCFCGGGIFSSVLFRDMYSAVLTTGFVRFKSFLALRQFGFPHILAASSFSDSGNFGDVENHCYVFSGL